MNERLTGRPLPGSGVLVAAALGMVLAGCASAPESPEGSAAVRTKLARLQSDPALASRAPVAIKEAEAAVRAAEEPLAAKDAALGAHRVYVADRKVEIASARASTRLAEDERLKLGEARAQSRLDARTREADSAREEAISAREDAAALQRSADEDARRAAREAEELQRQIDALEAEATDRGLVLTLGDVLFSTGQSDLKVGVTSNLNKLVTFLKQYPERQVVIEGHTDSVGSADYNQGLSQRRAEAVKSYLMQQGIDGRRLMTAGMGENQPLADNASATGRQMNRRVVVVIDNPAASSPAVSRL